MLGLGYRVRVRVTIRYGRQMSAMVIPRPHHFREGWGRMFCIPSFWSLHHRRRAWINNSAVGGVDQLSAATAAAAARYSCNRRCPAGREQVGRCGGLAGRRLPATTTPAITAKMQDCVIATSLLRRATPRASRHVLVSCPSQSSKSYICSISCRRLCRPCTILYFL